MSFRPFPRSLLLVFLTFIVVLTVVSCGSVAPGPDDVAVEWWTAFSQPDRDKLAELTCRAKRPDLEMAMNYMAIWTDVLPQALGGYLGIGDIDVGASASDLKPKILEEDKERAIVEVSGSMRLSAMGISGAQEFKYPISLIREDDNWVVCDDIVASIVKRLAGMDQLGLGLSQTGTGNQGQAVPGATLSVEQAVQATIEADKAANATATQQAVLALTPTATPTPTPLSEEDRQKAIATALARETVVAEILEGVTTIEYDRSNSWAPLVYGIDGLRVAVENAKGNIELRDVSNGQVIQEIELGNYRGTGSMALSSDYSRLATTWISGGSNALIWDLVDGKLLHVLDSDHGGIDNLSFSPDGQVLATQNRSTVVFWNVGSGSEIARFQPEEAYFTEIAFSPSGQLLAVVDQDEIHLIAVSDASLILTLTGINGSGPEQMVFDPTGTILGANYGSDAVLWNATDGEVLVALTERCITCYIPMAFSPDGRTFARKVDGTDTVAIMNTTTGESVQELNINDGSGRVSGVEDIAFSPDGNTLAVVYENLDRLVFWSIADGTKIGEISDDGTFRQWMISSDGNYLVAANPLRIFSIARLLDSIGQ